MALVGASADASRQTGRPLALTHERGFAGKLYPVNPNRTEVLGYECFPSLQAIGRPIDLALVLTPAASVGAVLADGIAAGVRSFIIYAAGFGEMGARGAEQQALLSRIARENGVSILGPNCVGVINARTGLCATWASGADALTRAAGDISFVGQSGALGSYWLDFVTKAGVGFAKWVTTGNEADVSIADVIAYLAQDPDTKIISAYLESAKNGRKLRQALELADAAGKTVIAMRAGRSSAGASAATSHTGALAGANEVWDGLLRQFNVIEVGSITEMFDATRLYLKRPQRSVRRPAIVSISGGAGVLISDALTDAGIPVEQPTPIVAEKLASIMPEFASSRNPIDLTAALGRDPLLMGRVIRALREDEGFDSILVFLGLVHRIAPVLSEIVRSELANVDKPVAMVWVGGLPNIVAEIEAAGIPVYPDIPAAVRAMELYGRLVPRVGRTLDPAHGDVEKASAGHTLSEHAGQSALGRAWPLAWPAHVLVRQPSDLPAALDGVSLPVAAKLQSAALPHKTEHGGVALGLRDIASIEAAVVRMLAKAKELGVPCEGVLLQVMVAHEIELMLGLRVDPLFGPVLVVGRGGTGAELEPDVAVRVLPVTAADVEQALLGLRCSKLFSGFRGNRPVDVGAVARQIAAVCEFYLGRPDLVEVEINPVALTGPAEMIGLDALVVQSKT